MEPYKREFIEFMVRSGVLTFGDFVAKSGRKTPYFVNTGKYGTGGQLRKLGHAYADAIEQNVGRDVDGRRVITDEIHERIARYRREYGPG